MTTGKAEALKYLEAMTPQERSLVALALEADMANRMRVALSLGNFGNLGTAAASLAVMQLGYALLGAIVCDEDPAKPLAGPVSQSAEAETPDAPQGKL